MRQAIAAIERAAATDTTVLLEGESGTGKELFARALHAASPRANGPFVAINCAAIPENLLETELFGHEKGAFTGAPPAQAGQVRDRAPRHAVPRRDRRDAARPAGEDPARPREHRFERVGGTGSLHVDVRMVAATNRNLRQAVAARQFREDLYFRLSVFPIAVPPLRDRPDDIPMLARHFVERFCREAEKKPLTLAPAAVAALLDYDWPGNVRELQNCIERAVILADGDTHPAAPPEPDPRRFARRRPRTRGTQIDLSGSLADVTAGCRPRSSGARSPRRLQ